ncbi:hypothetical protein ABIB62_000010 [Mucilaginibacter sp. UYP25]|uniref:hypothetical protein n=1 Tax=unclassified Mucilaginibacter TaxID=2617802 RepID=UPI003391A535
MTLISFTANYGRPILIGDLLTTSDAPRPAAQIPAFLSNIDDSLPDNASYPFELKQKIYVIKDTIALGLAGNVYQMTDFLKDIKGFFNYHESTEANLKKFMADYDKNAIDDCCILVFIVEYLGEEFHPSVHTHGNWEQYEDSLVQLGLITGSGKNAFFEKLALVNAGDRDEDKARTINLSLLSMFIAEERYTMDSIVEAWGAGFEVIEYSGGKFKKMDDHTFVICHSKLNETGTAIINEPFLIMHYTYHGEVLTINTYLASEFRRYGVLPLDIKRENIDQFDIPEYKGFRSSNVLCTFVIEKEDGGFFFTTVLTNGDNEENSILVKFEPPAPAYLEVHIDESITEMIYKGYRESYPIQD